MLYKFESYHIRFLGKDTIFHAFWCQPLQRQFDARVFILTKVFLSSNTLRESKISNFDDKININPV